MMAGFSKIYCVGGLGGFQGRDGINPIDLQILVGNGDRMWLEPHYFDNRLKPIGKIKKIIPEFPDPLNTLFDAIIAFAPKYFNNCPSLNEVKKDLKNVTKLDFDFARDKIPSSWNYLRREAKPTFERMNIFEAELSKINFNGR